MVIVDFHVHYLTQAYVDRPERYFRSPVALEFLRQQILPNIARLNRGRVPLTEEYLARMGDQGIDRAVVFGLADTISGCRELNDAVADLSLRYRQGAKPLSPRPGPIAEGLAYRAITRRGEVSVSTISYMLVTRPTASFSRNPK